VAIGVGRKTADVEEVPTVVRTVKIGDDAGGILNDLFDGGRAALLDLLGGDNGDGGGSHEDIGGHLADAGGLSRDNRYRVVIAADARAFDGDRVENRRGPRTPGLLGQRINRRKG